MTHRSKNEKVSSQNKMPRLPFTSVSCHPREKLRLWTVGCGAKTEKGTYQKGELTEQKSEMLPGTVCVTTVTQMPDCTNVLGRSKVTDAAISGRITGIL